jgi:hypothetical protein
LIFYAQNPQKSPAIEEKIKIRIHKCRLCDSSFKDKIGLVKHISRDHGKKSSKKIKKKSKECKIEKKGDPKPIEKEELKCKKCLRVFIRKEVLQRHRTIDCIGTPITQDYQCKICKKKYTNKGTVVTHIKKIHGKKENSKDYVEYLKVDHELDAGNVSEMDVVINVKASKNGPVIEPKAREDLEHDLSGLRDKLEIDRKNSNQSIRQKKNNSDTDSSSETEAIVNAMEIDSINNEYKCKICLQCGFKRERDIKMHLNVVHGGSDNAFPCQFCNKKFSWKRSLDRHITYKCPGKNSFQCKFCSEGFKTVNAFTHHLDVVHAKNSDGLQRKKYSNKYHCEYCDKNFTRIESLQDHHRRDNCKPKTVKKQYLYECELCQKTFKTMNYLYDHVHKCHQQNTMSHSCDLCHEKFADKSSLVKHALTSCPGKPLNSTENAKKVMSAKIIRLLLLAILNYVNEFFLKQRHIMYALKIQKISCKLSVHSV